MPDVAENNLLTINEIARLLGERSHRVAYAIERYDITPAQRLGIIRAFSRDQLPAIKAALQRTAAAASGGRCVF